MANEIPKNYSEACHGVRKAGVQSTAVSTRIYATALYGASGAAATVSSDFSEFDWP